MMKDTACGKDCPLVKSGVCQTDRECCNYIESWWNNTQTQEQTLIKDCAPKRSLLQQHQHANYIMGLQNDVNSLKEEIIKLSTMLTSLILHTRQYLEENEDKNLLN